MKYAVLGFLAGVVVTQLANWWVLGKQIMAESAKYVAQSIRAGK